MQTKSEQNERDIHFRFKFLFPSYASQGLMAYPGQPGIYKPVRRSKDPI